MTSQLSPQCLQARESCRVVESAADLAAHHAIRHAVFVAEQGLFTGSDADAHDADPCTLHVVGLVDGLLAGTVRLYALDAGGPDPACRWKGDRLAVLPDRRAGRLGAALVRFAVATAGARGGTVMTATIQQPNETFFRRLGWTRRGEPADYLGVPHVTMDIPLAH